MNITPSDLIRDIGGLVTLPEVYLRINRLMENADSSIADIAQAISQDPSFTVRLLRVANSALYAFPSAVNSVSKAVVIIGTAQVRNLALSMSAASSFKGLSNELVSMENFWRHSLLCALVARHLAKEIRTCDPDAMFTAGLLHDIGELVIFNRLPAEAEQALRMVLDSQDELSVSDAEQRIMGFDHADVGGELARQWRLPTLLEECISHHHQIDKALRHPREAALVHIANSLALMAELDTLDPADVSPIDPRAWDVCGIAAPVIEPAVHAAQAEIFEVEQLFLGA